MSDFFDPYNADRPLMMKCSCGRDHTVADHHAEVVADDAARELRARSETAEFEAYSNEFIEATLVKALFPQDEERRRFLRAVGKGTARLQSGYVYHYAFVMLLGVAGLLSYALYQWSR